MKLIDVCNPKQWKTISASELVEDGYPVFGANGIIGYFSDYNHEKPTLCITCRGATCGTVNKSLPYSYITGNSMALDDLDESVITIDFLYYFLQYRGFDDVITGSAQPQITRQSLSKIFIPEIDLNIQKNITQIIKSLEQLILNRDKQRENFNMLVKSRFNEMFGDISKFDVERLNNSVKEMFIGPFGSSLKNDYFVSKEKAYCMVYEQKHAIKKTMNLETRYVDEKKYKELKRFSIYGGDIIVSCRGTIGEIFQVPNNAPLGIMHPSIMKIRLDNSKYNPIFFKFMLSDYMDIEKIKSKGSGVKMAITASELGKIGFPLPPLSLQNEFADFVAQVDKSQLAIQKSLEELETLKKSLMQEYFG